MPHSAPAAPPHCPTDTDSPQANRPRQTHTRTHTHIPTGSAPAHEHTGPWLSCQRQLERGRGVTHAGWPPSQAVQKAVSLSVAASSTASTLIPRASSRANSAQSPTAAALTSCLGPRLLLLRRRRPAPPLPRTCTLLRQRGQGGQLAQLKSAASKLPGNARAPSIGIEEAELLKPTWQWKHHHCCCARCPFPWLLVLRGWIERALAASWPRGAGGPSSLRAV